MSARVFVPQVHDAARCPDDEARQHHPLDDEIGKVLQDYPVLEGSRLALVGVANHVLGGRLLGAHQLPLQARWKARASHPPEAALLEIGDQLQGRLVRIGLGERHPDSLVRALGIPVWVDLPGPVRPELTLRSALADHLGQGVHVRGAHGHSVDPHSRSSLAAPETRCLLDLHIVPVGERRPQPTGQPVGSGQVAAHVAAHRHLDRRRRRGAEMRIERDQLLQAVLGHRESDGQLSQVVLFQVSALGLQRFEFVDQAHQTHSLGIPTGCADSIEAQS